MSPYQSRTPWVVLVVLTSAAVLGVSGAIAWHVLSASEAPRVAEVPPVVEPRSRPPAPKPPRPAAGTRTRKAKASRVAQARTPAPTPPPVEVAAPAAPAAPVEVAAPAPRAEPAAPPVPPGPEPAVTAPPMVPTEPQPAPEVDEAPLSFDGNGEQIARAVASAKRRAVQQCFERELKRTPELRGTVNVELDLAPPQKVNAVRVSDDLDRPELTRCVADSMQRLNFVGLNEEVTIHVPYVLSPRAK
jgi:hypothetical protein